MPLSSEVTRRPSLLLIGLFVAASANAATAGPCDVPPGARQVAVRDFQAVGDGKTDDGGAIRAALKSALEGPKPAVVEFEPRKIYRISSAEETYSLQILNGKNVTLRGNGSELSLLPPNKAMRIEKSSDINICGLTFDYLPLPFTQGTIVATDPAAGTFDLAIEDGFDVPQVDDDSVTDNSSAWRFAMPFRDDKHDRRVQLSAVYAGKSARQIKIKSVRPQDVERLTPNKTQLVMTKPMMSQIGGFAFRIAENERVHFETIRIYSVPRMTFVIVNNLGLVSFTDVEQRRRPGTTRLMTGWQDIFHAINNRAPVTWDGCYVERVFDDSFNLSALFQQVVEKLDGDNRWRLRDLSITDRAPPFRVGDRLQAIDLTPERKLLGQSTIVAVSQSGGESIVSISPSLPLTPESTGCASSKEPAGVCGSRVVDIDAANEGSVIKRCTVHGSIRLRSKATVDTIKMDGPLQITADPIRVGPLPNGTVIKNSELSGTIRIGPDNTERAKYNEQWNSGERWAKNIVFENNRITSLFRAEGAAFSLIGDNFIWPRRRKIAVSNSGPIRVKNFKADGYPSDEPASRFRPDQNMMESDIVVERGQ